MHPIENAPPTSGTTTGKDRFFQLLQAAFRLILSGIAARGAAIAVLNPSQAHSFAASRGGAADR